MSGKVLGKAVLLELAAAGKAPETVMCVLRAPDHIELGRIAAATGCATARVLSEAEVRVWPIPLRRACPPPSGSSPPHPLAQTERKCALCPRAMLQVAPWAGGPCGHHALHLGHLTCPSTLRLWSHRHACAAFHQCPPGRR